MRMARTQTGTRISHLGPATETKSDRSEFIVRPLSCKRIKGNVSRSILTHASLSSSRSHINTSLVVFVRFNLFFLFVSGFSIRLNKRYQFSSKFKNLFMLRVRMSSYGCTREVWRARKMGKICTRR